MNFYAYYNNRKRVKPCTKWIYLIPHLKLIFSGSNKNDKLPSRNVCSSNGHSYKQTAPSAVPASKPDVTVNGPPNSRFTVGCNRWHHWVSEWLRKTVQWNGSRRCYLNRSERSPDNTVFWLRDSTGNAIWKNSWCVWRKPGFCARGSERFMQIKMGGLREPFGFRKFGPLWKSFLKFN